MAKSKDKDATVAKLPPLSREQLNAMIKDSGYQVMVGETEDTNRKVYRACFFITIGDKTHVGSDIPRMVHVLTEQLGAVWIDKYGLNEYANDARIRAKQNPLFAVTTSF